MRRKRAQAGFTLVEMMVSLVLFSFAIAGVLAVAVSMAQGFREQRQIVETESSTRGALDYIADSIRMASPAVRTAVVRTHVGNSLVIEPSATAAIEDTMGASPGNPCPQGSVTVSNNTGLNGSDVLEVVVASGPVVTTMMSAWTIASTGVDLADTSSLAIGDTLLLTDGSDGRLVRIKLITSATHVDFETYNCTVTAPSAGTYAVGSLAIRAMRAKFFLFNNVTDGVPTALYMDPDGDGALDAEPLADYVEDFQVAVGIDESTPLDKTIATTEWAYSGVLGTPNPFTAGKPLHAIRISLVARAKTPLNGTTTYPRPTLEDHAPGGSDSYRRRVLSTSVEIRNLGDSP